jgi:hypothetical protein
MKGKQETAPYTAEIMTASREGLLAFLAKLKAIRDAHPVTKRLGRDGDGGPVGATIAVTGAPYKSAPIGPLTSNSLIAPHLGPLNRTIVPSRVTEYQWAMWRGDWWFTPDPIVVTDEGHIINGQHRLMAAEEVIEADRKDAEVMEAALRRSEPTKPEAAEDLLSTLALSLRPKRTKDEARAELEKIRARQYPQFVVVWGVDKRAAILMDEARRSSTDRRDIAIRYAQSNGSSTQVMKKHGARRMAPSNETDAAMT